MRYVPDYADRDYDAWHDAIREERNRLARDRCQCRHMDMPGTCPGPRHCPMVEHDDEGDDE